MNGERGKRTAETERSMTDTRAVPRTTLTMGTAAGDAVLNTLLAAAR